jgi:hypothetical protein
MPIPQNAEPLLALGAVGVAAVVIVWAIRQRPKHDDPQPEPPLQSEVLRGTSPADSADSSRGRVPSAPDAVPKTTRDIASAPAVVNVLQFVAALVIGTGIVGALALWAVLDSEAAAFIAVGVAISDVVVGLILIALAAIIRELHLLRTRAPRN